MRVPQFLKQLASYHFCGEHLLAVMNFVHLAKVLKISVGTFQSFCKRALLEEIILAQQHPKQWPEDEDGCGTEKAL